jgi:hypothetical protein
MATKLNAKCREALNALAYCEGLADEDGWPRGCDVADLEFRYQDKRTARLIAWLDVLRMHEDSRARTSCSILLQFWLAAELGDPFLPTEIFVYDLSRRRRGRPKKLHVLDKNSGREDKKDLAVEAAALVDAGLQWRKVAQKLIPKECGTEDSTSKAMDRIRKLVRHLPKSVCTDEPLESTDVQAIAYHLLGITMVDPKEFI